MSNTPCDTKKCTKCNEEKPLTEFGNKGAGRKRADCKACFRVVKDKWKERNPERHSISRSAYLEKNKEATAIKRKIREAESRAEKVEQTRLRREAAKQEREELNRIKIAQQIEAREARILSIKLAKQNKEAATDMECRTCCDVKPVSEFYNQFTGVKCTECKPCHNARMKRLRSADPGYKGRTKLYRKEWCKRSKSLISRYTKLWKARIKGTPQGARLRMKNNLRSRMSELLKTKDVSSKSEMFGCTGVFLQRHIEAQFTKGMTWANYGQWHVDHIIPCAAFDHSNPDQVRQCWNWQNLRPLWAADNLAKSDTITHPQQHLALSFI